MTPEASNTLVDILGFLQLELPPFRSHLNHVWNRTRFVQSKTFDFGPYHANKSNKFLTAGYNTSPHQHQRNTRLRVQDHSKHVELLLQQLRLLTTTCVWCPMPSASTPSIHSRTSNTQGRRVNTISLPLRLGPRTHSNSRPGSRPSRHQHGHHCDHYHHTPHRPRQ